MSKISVPKKGFAKITKSLNWRKTHMHTSTPHAKEEELCNNLKLLSEVADFSSVVFLLKIIFSLLAGFQPNKMKFYSVKVSFRVWDRYDYVSVKVSLIS
jgi:hypothetical protein